MIQRRILTAVVVVMIAVSAVVPALKGTAFAAQTSLVGGNALKISPVRQDLTMDPGTSKKLVVFITNVTSVTTTLHMAINDFVASGDESGKPSVILDENQYAPTHSFKQFATPVKDFTLKGNETKEIDVAVNIPKTAPGGGYYGAIRFEPASASGDRSLNLSASVGSLVLLKVNGTITEKMTVASFDVQQNKKSAFFFTSSKGLTNVVRFQNSGNVQLEPFGKVILKRFGKQVAEYEINNESPRGSVLPDSIRRFDTSLNKVSSFGKFTLSGNFGYGSSGQLVSASATFYVIPVTMIILIGAAIVGLVILIFVLPKLIRSYNSRIIRNANRRR